MRILVFVFGALMVLLGVIWIGQGLGYVGGSFMTGDIMWAYIGFIVGVVGIGVIWLGATRRRS
ncbi:MAG TPA: hypothetical protein VJO34_01995 [Methylomirabilota bacterium]|nr:hypothetical protein [Methylomirabilota bacterium]